MNKLNFTKKVFWILLALFLFGACAETKKQNKDE